MPASPFFVLMAYPRVRTHWRTRAVRGLKGNVRATRFGSAGEESRSSLRTAQRVDAESVIERAK